MISRSSLIPSIVFGLALLLIPGTVFATTERYVITFNQTNLDASTIAQAIEDAGGQVMRNHPASGLVIAESSDPDFETAIESDSLVEGCFNDRVNNSSLSDPVLAPEDIFATSAPLVDNSAFTLTGESGSSGGPHLENIAALGGVTDPTQANGFSLQWGLRKIFAPEAWALGALGDPDVEIAIISSGLDYTHTELQGKVDLERSISLLPEEDALVEQLHPGMHPVLDLNWIGTFDASMAACNAVNTACVAPNATLIGVKAMDKAQEYRFGDLISGVLYAADLRVDIIHVGAAYTELLSWLSSEDRQVIRAYRRAVLHAFLKGALVIIEGGIGPIDPELGVNRGIDADADGPFQVIFPMQASYLHLVVNSAGIEDETLFIQNWGRTLIDITAPGGRQEEPFPVTDFVIGPCTNFSLRFPSCATGTSRYIFSSGSHAATGHAVGVAALIESVTDRNLHGFQLRHKLLRATDDIGDPGFDEFFGRGLVNALKAVTQN